MKHREARGEIHMVKRFEGKVAVVTGTSSGITSRKLLYHNNLAAWKRSCCMVRRAVAAD
jgi:hypothetical protein